ncbi:MAG: hypothetical protein QOH39_166 [Verrucomicrobiota bacterium]
MNERINVNGKFRGAHAPRVQTPVRLGLSAPRRNNLVLATLMICPFGKEEKFARAGVPSPARGARALPKEE